MLQGISRLRALVSHFNDPYFWPHFLRLGLRRVKVRMHVRQHVQEREAAARWCSERAISREEAVARLGAAGLDSVEERHPKHIAAAADRYSNYRIDFLALGMAGPAELDLLYTLCRHLGARTVLETGVALGWSSLAVLLHFSERGDGHLYSTDAPFIHFAGNDWVGLCVPPELHERWTLLRMADREGLPRALRHAGPLDLAHYDSDKSRNGRLFAYPRIWNVLKPGGVLISDDISDNMAWADFCSQLGIESIITTDASARKFVGILRKPSGTASAGANT